MHRDDPRDYIERYSSEAIGMSGTTPTGQREPSARHLSNIRLTVNGVAHDLTIDTRATLLDTLRERLGLPGTKTGCDRGECGACTVHVNDRRILACMTLAIMQDGQHITTIEGMAAGGTLTAVQTAFIDHDAFQCGYCTSGQIMSAAACIHEGHASDADAIRHWMSGNLCRCGAYPNIVRAVAAAARRV
jgi:xanthine dehydrogenase YagT iron-sulfur-binding subunit